MTTQYLVRFDDICPTMDWAAWHTIERILIDTDIRPILAVVPDNRDPALNVAPPNPKYWDCIRAYQARGWTIAMHGYQHLYTTNRAGLVGINSYSEFAGVPEQDQEQKLVLGLDILRSHGLQPEAWIAPAHSFDETTVKVLVRLGINRLSDGFYPMPHVDRYGMEWIPQQLWRFRPAPPGLWTVCMHHNGWSRGRIAQFERDITRYRDRITTFSEASRAYSGRKRRWSDVVVGSSLRTMLIARLALERKLSYGSQ